MHQMEKENWINKVKTGYRNQPYYSWATLNNKFSKNNQKFRNAGWLK